MDQHIHSLAEAMLATTVGSKQQGFMFPIIDVLDKVRLYRPGQHGGLTVQHLGVFVLDHRPVFEMEVLPCPRQGVQCPRHTPNEVPKYRQPRRVRRLSQLLWWNCGRVAR